MLEFKMFSGKLMEYQTRHDDHHNGDFIQ